MRPTRPKPITEEHIAFRIRQITKVGSEFSDFKRILELTDKMLQGVGTHQYKSILGTYIYRGIRMKKGERPITVSRVFAPKSSQVTDYGRCNPIGHAMLYCASDVDTVLREMRVTVGEVVHVGKWRIDDVFHVCKVPPKPAPGQSEAAFERLAKYVNDQFTRPVNHAMSHEYKLSAAFSVCYARGEMDRANPQITLPLASIHYRSAIPFALGSNLAIHPKIAEQVLFLVELSELIITAVTEDRPIEYSVVLEEGYPAANPGTAKLDQPLVWEKPKWLLPRP